jgi:tetratricopeptide (TPR) repeat protein
MSFRARVAGIIALTAVLGACGGGGGGGASPGAIAPQAALPEDMPAWVLALPEGEAPRDNDQTGQASLFLFQAQSTDDPARAATAYQQALGAAEAGIQLDPTNPQSHLQAGQAHLGLGNLPAADAALTEAERLYPRYALDVNYIRETEWIEAFNEGVQAMQVDDQPTAIAALERAHSIYRGRPEAMIQLGALYSLNGQLEEAAEMFGAALEMMEGPLAERIEDAALVATFPENIEVARFQRAQLLFQLERYAEAAEVYQQVVDANPTDLMAVSNLGASLVAAGETERASAIYEQLLSRTDLSVRDYNLIAIGAYNGDLFLQAAEAFGRAHEALPQNRDYLYNQAQALYLYLNPGVDGPAPDPALVPTVAADLVDVATRLTALDTHNRNAYRFLLNAQQTVQADQDAIIAVLEAMEKPIELPSMQLAAVDGGYVLAGEVTNHLAEPGSTASVTFRFYDSAGTEVAMEQMNFTLPGAGETAAFEVEVPTQAEVLGYNYVVN